MERPGDSIHTIDTLRARGGIPDVWNKLQALHVSRNENISHARGASQKGKYYILDPTPSSYLISGVIVDIGCRQHIAYLEYVTYEQHNEALSIRQHITYRISLISNIPKHSLEESIPHNGSMSHISNIPKQFLVRQYYHMFGVYHIPKILRSTLQQTAYWKCPLSTTYRSTFSQILYQVLGICYLSGTYASTLSQI